MTDEITWTPEELSEFDLITWKSSSPDQVMRIEGRQGIKKLIERHGKAKCDAMFEHLEKPAKKKRQRK